MLIVNMAKVSNNDCSKCSLTAFWDLYEAKQADSSGASTQNQAELDGKDSCSVDV